MAKITMAQVFREVERQMAVVPYGKVTVTLDRQDGRVVAFAIHQERVYDERDFSERSPFWQEKQRGDR